MNLEFALRQAWRVIRTPEVLSGMTFRDLWRRDGKISVGLKNGGGLKTTKGQPDSVYYP